MKFTLSLPGLLAANDAKKSSSKQGLPDSRSFERMQHDIHRILEQENFDSVEEMQDFVNKNIIGKQVPHQQADTPLEQAQDLVYDALEARGRKQLQLVRKALQICPDCAEAYVLLGSLPAAIEQLQIGLKSGDGDYYQLSSAEARLRELRDADSTARSR